MVQGYYTLQEAAQVLDMTVDELKAMAQRNQIRSFQDRGTLRFRIQDIQELQRQKLGDSDPELVLGDSPASPKPSKGGDSPKSGAKSLKTPKPSPAGQTPEVFDFQLSDSVELGNEALEVGGSAARKGGSGAKAPRTPKAGSDSDVKLFADGSDDFNLQADSAPKAPTDASDDSDVRLGDLSTNKRTSGASSRKLSRRSSKLGPSPADSGVRLVPMGGDSDIRLDSAATDSDVRLNKGSAPSHRAAENMINTDEIDLDAEAAKHEAAAKKPETKFKTNPSKLGKPGSPFELSDSDLDEPTRAESTQDSDSGDFDIVAPPKSGARLSGPKSGGPKSGGAKSGGKGGPKTPPKKKKETEFEISAADSDEDFSLVLDDESLDLGGEPDADADAPKSGLNLSRPLDAGISLEAPTDDEASADFELNLEGAPATPKPVKKQEVDSDSEFELSLDDSSSETPALQESDDSEFELSLGDGSESSETAPDSDGEFELALDDGDATQQLEAPKKKKKGQETEEKDIFETDFELPAVDDESPSGEETVDEASSDFELALDDSDIAEEDASGSQVVALQEEEYDAGGETVDGDLEGFDEGDIQVDDDVEVEEDREVEVREKVVVQEVVREKWIKPAPWGVLPTVFMLPCVIVMVLAGIMGWELVQSSSGYRSAGFLTRSIAEPLGVKVK